MGLKYSVYIFIYFIFLLTLYLSGHPTNVQQTTPTDLKSSTDKNIFEISLCEANKHFMWSILLQCQYIIDGNCKYVLPFIVHSSQCLKIELKRWCAQIDRFACLYCVFMFQSWVCVCGSVSCFIVFMLEFIWRKAFWNGRFERQRSILGWMVCQGIMSSSYPIESRPQRSWKTRSFAVISVP